MPQTVTILGFKIFTGTQDEALDEIQLLAERQAGQQVYFVSALRLLKARLSKKYAALYKQASLLLPTGCGLKWASKKYHNPVRHLFSPVDLFMDLLRAIIENKQTVFFLGSKAQTMSKAVDNFRKNFPALRILGSHAGYFDQKRSVEIIQAINKFTPQFLFIGMGFPKQEFWINNNKKDLPALVTVTVGHAFDLSAGESKRGPVWMRKAGLEGLYKALRNPARFIRFPKLFLFFWLVTINSFKLNRQKKKNRIPVR